MMDFPCLLKIAVVIICLFVVILGLYLCVLREKSSIITGQQILQSGNVNVPQGTIKFDFVIGLALVLLGICGAIWANIFMHGCEVTVQQSKPPLPIEDVRVEKEKEQKIKPRKEAKLKHEPEDDGIEFYKPKSNSFFVSGVLLSKNGGKGISDVQVQLIRLKDVKPCTTDSNGGFQFVFDNFNNYGESTSIRFLGIKEDTVEYGKRIQFSGHVAIDSSSIQEFRHPS